MSFASHHRKAILIALLLIAPLVPAVLLIMIGQRALAAPVMYGAIISAAAVLYSSRLAIVLSLSGGAAATVLVLVNPYPVLGGVTFGLITAYAAFEARRGLHSATMMVPIFTAFLLTSPPTIAGVDSTLVTAGIVGAVLGVGGLWVVAVARLLLGDHLPRLPRHPVGPRTSTIYAGIAGVIVAIAAWAILTSDPTHAGAWLLLTLLILLQPDPHDSTVKTLQRLGGTLLGGLIAIPFIVISLPAAVTLTLGTVFLFGALTARYAYRRRYWEYVVPLTVGVILLDSSTADRAQIALDRVGFTLLGGAIVIAISIGAKAYARHWYRAHPTETA